MHPTKTKVNRTISMTNISDQAITIHIGGSPGDGVTEHVIEPGGAQHFHENYCKPVAGAGTENMPPILARHSLRECADGVRRPMLVPTAEADKTKAAYAEAIRRNLKAKADKAKAEAEAKKGAA